MVNKTVYKLVLYPENVEYAPKDWTQIKDKLLELGFIGKPLIGSELQFLVGDEFLQLITFLGCSPQIQLEPDETGEQNHCYVALSDISEVPKFRTLARDVAVRCPDCRKKIDHMNKYIEVWQKTAELSEITCEFCESKTPIHLLDWRHSAAFARCFIDIAHIYPQEAIPGDELLVTLKKVSGQRWNYFFSE